MKLQNPKLNKHLLPIVSVGAAVLVAGQSAQAATILDGPGSDPLWINNSSNAPGTPNIALTWSVVGSGSFDARGTWDNSGANGVYLLNGDGDFDGTDTFKIAFTPENASIKVNINSLTLNTRNGGVPVSLEWLVRGTSSGVITSGSTDVGGGTVENLNLNIMGVAGEKLTVEFKPTYGYDGFFAIDNISFDQVAVPEPSSVLLAGAGLGALAMRRRRK